MKNLLENELPAYYNVGRRCACDELITTKNCFDLTEDDAEFVVEYKKGFASFSDNPYRLSVVNYDTYIGRFEGTKVANDKRRCDFILTDLNSDDIVILCEVTSSIGSVENLSKPIFKTKRDGTKVIMFPNGKYEKAELQLYQSLENIIAVPSIKMYIENKKRKVCLMSYLIKPAKDEAVKAFNRNRETEAEEAGENGAQMSSPQIEQFGFLYYRISHSYSFKIRT